ncbi:hypothetical protein [Nocardia caishijiensis]|uniref:Uncharacterized protein n=1 Tax=Nocardia caishijiensis TaxID=184756 RepID=A0ABQ6YI75_9NOCA|nr:hypothetical protein [Nocardia caishijiensis]KAF0845285.1 hypothetical protein FNL39_10893 [Nocardia caishijiensis]
MNPHRNTSVARLILLETTLGTALTQANTAEEQRRAAQDREQEQRDAQRRRAVQPRRDNDYAALGFAALACLTVLGPYLLGHFLVRKTFLLAPDSRVYDDQARGLADHFWADYLGGVVAIGALLAVFLLARPWEFRRREVVIGGVIAAVTLVFVMPTASSQWHDAEGKTITALRESAFPFGARYVECANWQLEGEDASGRPELWQVYLAQTLGSPRVRDCNRVNVYQGWRSVGAFDLDGNDHFTESITVDNVNWSKPFTTDRSTTIYSTDAQGRRERMKPADLTVTLPTTNGRAVVFNVAGSASGRFEVR